jgi:hypothetical protein
MKRALIFIIIIIFFAVSACKKKSPSQNCYQFFITDSIFSNIHALMRVTNDSQIHCAMTNDMRNAFIKQYSGVDTSKNKNDTLIIDHWSSSWNFY